MIPVVYVWQLSSNHCHNNLSTGVLVTTYPDTWNAPPFYVFLDLY